MNTTQEPIDRAGARPMHQGPWWKGYNDARNGRAYSNIYGTRTAQFEYHEGWLAGGGE